MSPSAIHCLRPRRHHLLGGLVAALGAACLLLACDSGSSTASDSRRSTIRGYVVISLDTLRADHLGLYDYPRPTSPFLDSLTTRATVFDEAYASFPSTLTSHMTMFTGLHPREHGVYPPAGVLSPEIETFPEVFQRAGYRTAAVTEGGYVSGRYGFKRGFEQFVARDRKRRRNVAPTFERALAFLGRLGPDERFLLFLHTYAIHAPYDAPESYQQLFWSGPPPTDAIPATPTALTRVSERGDVPSAAAIEHLTARYDAGIRETDDHLGRFFARLEALGLADETVVIVTSDHGEELLEHGRLDHSQLYREVMHVPLVIVHPGRPTAVRQPNLVQLSDLAPTLYELAGLTPAVPVSGRSLVAGIGHPLPASPANAWSESSGGSRAVYQGMRGELASLHLFEPPADRWVNRRVAFDATGDELVLEARARAGERRLTVRTGGEPLLERTIGPDWDLLRLPLPGRPTRIAITADDCTEEGSGRKYSCLAFQLRGAALRRIELYDVDRDPLQQHDLAHQQPDDVRRLLRELTAFAPPPRGAAQAVPLEPELERKIEALGYLD